MSLMPGSQRVTTVSPYREEHWDPDLVHAAHVDSTEGTVGITSCGLLFDLAEFAIKGDHTVVIARPTEAPVGCFECLVTRLR